MMPIARNGYGVQSIAKRHAWEHVNAKTTSAGADHLGSHGFYSREGFYKGEGVP